MSKLSELKKRALENTEVKEAYDELETEFRYISTLMEMRKLAGLSQEEVACLMGTAKSNISRLEGGRTNPSWLTLKKYADACGCQIELNITQRPQ